MLQSLLIVKRPSGRPARGLTWLLLSVIKAAVSASLDDSKHQEAAQPYSPDDDQDSGKKLSSVVVFGIGQCANCKSYKGGAAQSIIQLVCLQRS